MTKIRKDSQLRGEEYQLWFELPQLCHSMIVLVPFIFVCGMTVLTVTTGQRKNITIIFTAHNQFYFMYSLHFIVK